MRLPSRTATTLTTASDAPGCPSSSDLSASNQRQRIATKNTGVQEFCATTRCSILFLIALTADGVHTAQRPAEATGWFYRRCAADIVGVIRCLAAARDTGSRKLYLRWGLYLGLLDAVTSAVPIDGYHLGPASTIVS